MDHTSEARSVPDTSYPLAEETGLISSRSPVLISACKQSRMHSTSSEHAAPLSVNVPCSSSARFRRTVAFVLEQSGLAASSLASNHRET